LVEKGRAGKQVIRQGEDIFVPNLSLRHFLSSYSNKISEEQIVAYAFLLGVSDATEGKIWCSYKIFKTITLLETIHSEVKELDLSHYDERAAYTITEILKHRYPCNKER
jgi:hypothetical protein